MLQTFWKMRWLLLLMSAPAAVAYADAPRGETIEIGGVRNVLLRADRPKGSVLLLTGGDGRLEVGANGAFATGADNVLIRNREAFRQRGYNVLLVELGTDLSAAVDRMVALKRPVTMIATSKGTQRAAEGLQQGALPDKLILTSGFLTAASGPAKSVKEIVGDPTRLPPTLVVHHRDDDCHFTRPAGVMPFKAWAAERIEIAWLSGGSQGSNPCRFDAHHGFAGQDDALVARIVAFLSR